MAKACKTGEGELIDSLSPQSDLWDRLQFRLRQPPVVDSSPSSILALYRLEFPGEVYHLPSRSVFVRSSSTRQQPAKTNRKLNKRRTFASIKILFYGRRRSNERAPNFSLLLKNFVDSLELRAGNPKRSPKLASTFQFSSQNGKVATKSKKFCALWRTRNELPAIDQSGAVNVKLLVRLRSPRGGN